MSSTSGDRGFDYIVVGAGSAGCVLAARLSEDPSIRVLLLEAGPADDSWTIRMPIAQYINYMGGAYNWSFHTVPQPHLNGRRLYAPRGKTLGGSSAINGMVYVRGNAMDYERWVDEGADGWSYAEVLPYFRRGERHASGGDAYRGEDGPVAVTKRSADDPLNLAFIAAGLQAGYPETGDVNGHQQEGFGRFDMTVDNGVRASTARAYLHPNRRRDNLHVITGALTTRILFDRRRAIGVEYLRDGSPTSAQAEREVILAAGAVASPQLLLLSGVGPADDLKQRGIDVVLDLPGVGCNLQDHLEMHMQYTCPVPVALNRYASPLPKLWAGLRWFLGHRGPCTTNAVECGAFIRSRAGVTHPDIQYHFFPVLLDGWEPSTKEHGFCTCVGTLREHSRGTVRLGSADPRDPPLIDPNYLSVAQDLVDLRECVKLTREIVGQESFDGLRGSELHPGDAVQTDDQIDDYIRSSAESSYHFCGTCRMGQDPMAVVDPHTRVHGFDNLRVVDTAIMPSITSGNLNAPAMMMGEKAADLILGKEPLPPSNQPFYTAANRQQAQR